jgi:hypothetical protein
LLRLQVAISVIRSRPRPEVPCRKLRSIVLMLAAAVSNAAGVRAQDLPFQPTPEQRPPAGPITTGSASA